MNAEYDRARKRVEKYTKVWHARLGFDELGITILHGWSTSYNETDHTTVATTEASWQYREAKIEWHLPAVTRLDDDRLESCVVHEFIHVLLAPMEVKLPDRYADQREFAVETMARALRHLVK